MYEFTFQLPAPGSGQEGLTSVPLQRAALKLYNPSDVTIESLGVLCADTR